MAAERLITLTDIRNVVKSPDGKGILTGWFAPNSEHPVPEGIQEMADDILTWFDASQRWRLVEVRTGVINAQRIEESNKLPAPFRLENSMQIKAKIKEPDKFTPMFHFDAENPPLKRGFLGNRKQPEVDFPKVFSSDFKDKVRSWSPRNATVFPVKVGSVYPLEQAMEKLSSPYYLVGVNVSLNRRAEKPFERSNPPSYEPPKSLAVMVIAHDLGDYLKLQSLGMRRARTRFDRKFSQ